jgi:hypothetical protein
MAKAKKEKKVELQPFELTRMSAHPLYIVWHGMKRRCYEVTFKNYDIYGGRGIKVCRAWRLNFLLFFEWAINNGWSKGLHIDRKNGDGNYSPRNCRIATPKQNANNKRNTKYYIIDGVRKPFTEWCELKGLNSKSIAKRLKRGYSIEESLKKELPPLTGNHSKKRVELLNILSNEKIIFDSINTCASYLGVDPSNITYAIKNDAKIKRSFKIKLLGFFIPKNEKEKNICR